MQALNRSTTQPHNAHASTQPLNNSTAQPLTCVYAAQFVHDASYMSEYRAHANKNVQIASSLCKKRARDTECAGCKLRVHDNRPAS